MPSSSGIDMEEMAANYGWSMAVLQSNPELKKAFAQAVANDWSPQRFVAAVRNTKWYRTTSASARQAMLLQKTDPAEWKRRLQQMSGHIRTLYGQMSGGQKLSANWLKSATSQAVMFGWTDEELQRHIAADTGYRTLMAQHKLGGQAGQAEDQIRKSLGDYGIKVSEKWIAGRVRAMMMGQDSIESIQDYIRKYAKAQYRAYAPEIDQGLTVRDLAEPYMQSMAKVLEINPASLDIFDKKIQSALTAYDADSGKPTTKPLWQFENELRSDPRWNKTQNAQDSLMAVGHSVLQQMGLVT